MYDCCMGRGGFDGRGCILADEMGLGKTLQAVALIWTLLEQGPQGRPAARQAAIVAPSSLCANWGRELDAWLGAGAVTYLVVGGQRNDSVERDVRDFSHGVRFRVLVISYSQLLRFAEPLAAAQNLDLLVVDEGHRLKNPDIKTVQCQRQLRARMRVVLTGTPLQNNLDEFFAVVDFANPGLLGTRDKFERVFNEPILRSREPGAHADARRLGEARAGLLMQLTGSCMLRRTAEILLKYLPPKHMYVVFCRPSAAQAAVCRLLLTSLLEDGSAEQLSRTDAALSLITLLQKLFCHPSLVLRAFERQESDALPAAVAERLASAVRELLQQQPRAAGGRGAVTDVALSGKLSVLEELMVHTRRHAPGERFVIVSNYTQNLDVVERLCSGRSWGFVRLDGSTSVARRQQLVDEFNRPTSQQFAFLLSSKAGGVGLNLVGANRLVLLDASWNPSDDLQAMARVHRQGQRRPCYIYRLVTTGTLEERVYQRQVNKLGLSANIVDGKAGVDQQFAAEDLRNLFFLSGDTASDTHDRLRCPRCPVTGRAAVAASAIELSAPAAADGPPRRLVVRKQARGTCTELLAWAHHPGLDGRFVDPVLVACSAAARARPSSEAAAVSFVFSLEAESAAVQEDG